MIDGQRYEANMEIPRLRYDPVEPVMITNREQADDMFGMPVREDPRIPEDEIRFLQPPTTSLSEVANIDYSEIEERIIAQMTRPNPTMQAVFENSREGAERLRAAFTDAYPSVQQMAASIQQAADGMGRLTGDELRAALNSGPTEPDPEHTDQERAEWLYDLRGWLTRDHDPIEVGSTRFKGRRINTVDHREARYLTTTEEEFYDRSLDMLRNTIVHTNMPSYITLCRLLVEQLRGAYSDDVRLVGIAHQIDEATGSDVEELAEVHVRYRAFFSSTSSQSRVSISPLQRGRRQIDV